MFSLFQFAGRDTVFFSIQGATDDELSEFSYVYEERGCVTIRWVSESHYLFLMFS